MKLGFIYILGECQKTLFFSGDLFVSCQGAVGFSECIGHKGVNFCRRLFDIYGITYRWLILLARGVFPEAAPH